MVCRQVKGGEEPRAMPDRRFWGFQGLNGSGEI